MRTRETIEAQSEDVPSLAPKKRKIHPNSLKNLCAPWKPGHVANPTGKNGRDFAQEIAKAVFEQNPVALYKAYAKTLLGGSAFGFQVLADRAYGKLKESKEINHTYNETADGDLAERIAALERDLGLARTIDEAGRIGITEARADKANGAAKDSELLPR